MQMNSQTNASENNAASNHISANAGNGSKTVENSDEESDAQVSMIWLAPCRPGSEHAFGEKLNADKFKTIK
jgi:hypothetical protein